MKTGTWKGLIILLAIVNQVLPATRVVGADPQQPNEIRIPANIKIPDVTLGPDGTLTGQALDAQGKAKVKYAIQVEQNGKIVGKTKTNGEGHFVVPRIGAGVSKVITDDATFVCRCWTAAAAPPASKEQLLVISQEGVERGQRPVGEIVTNPLFVGAVIAAAIAIPIAVHGSKKSGS